MELNASLRDLQQRIAVGDKQRERKIAGGGCASTGSQGKREIGGGDAVPEATGIETQRDRGVAEGRDGAGGSCRRNPAVSGRAWTSRAGAKGSRDCLPRESHAKQFASRTAAGVRLGLRDANLSQGAGGIRDEGIDADDGIDYARRWRWRRIEGGENRLRGSSGKVQRAARGETECEDICSRRSVSVEANEGADQRIGDGSCREVKSPYSVTDRCRSSTAQVVQAGGAVIKVNVIVGIACGYQADVCRASVSVDGDERERNGSRTSAAAYSERAF